VKAATQFEKDAHEVGRGGGITLVSTVIDRFLRFFVTWLLARSLDLGDFSVFTLAATVVVVATNFTHLGFPVGLVYFGTRYLVERDHAGWKGALIGGGVAVLLVSLVALVGMAVVSHVWFPPTLATSLSIAGVTILPFSLLYHLVGALRTVRDMAGASLALNVALPAALLVGVSLALVAGTGVQGVLVAYGVAHVVALGVAARITFKHFGEVLLDRAIKLRFEARALLAYCLPTCFTAVVYRLTTWTDLLMLGWLAGVESLGLYKVALSLAVLGTLPVGSFLVAFSPVAADAVRAGDREHLDRILKAVTSGLLILTIPVFLTLLAMPELVSLVFSRTFRASDSILGILVVGQLLHVACSPAGRLLVMSGRSRLALINASAALALNVTLNYALIPPYGLTGAAASSAVTLAFLATLRIIQVRLLLGCFPLAARTGLLLGCVVPVALGLRFVAQRISLPLGAALLALAVAGYFGLLWILRDSQGGREVVAMLPRRIRARL